MKHLESIIQHAIDGLENIQEGTDVNDLHHHLFNEDYFLIGYYQCEQWLKENDISAFDAIGEIEQYEIDNFGEVATKLDNSESVVNMYAYIKGEELLQDVITQWNCRVDEDYIDTLKARLENML